MRRGKAVNIAPVNLMTKTDAHNETAPERRGARGAAQKGRQETDGARTRGGTGETGADLDAFSKRRLVPDVNVRVRRNSPGMLISRPFDWSIIKFP